LRQSTSCQQYPGHRVISSVGSPWGDTPGASRKHFNSKTIPAGLKKAWSCRLLIRRACFRWVTTALQIPQRMASSASGFPVDSECARGVREPDDGSWILHHRGSTVRLRCFLPVMGNNCVHHVVDCIPLGLDIHMQAMLSDGFGGDRANGGNRHLVQQLV